MFIYSAMQYENGDRMAHFIPPKSGTLPKAGKVELAEVYSGCRAHQPKGEPHKGMCAAIAWKQVEREGYHKNRFGVWVKS